MCQDQFDRIDRSAADPAAHGLLKARHFPFERCVHQVIFSPEAIDETTLAYAGTRGDGVERETSATGSGRSTCSSISRPPVPFITMAFIALLLI